MKNKITVALIIIMAQGYVAAGTSIGLIQAARKRVTELDEKVAARAAATAPNSPLIPTSPPSADPGDAGNGLQGGKFLFVPGNPALGTGDFYVMKYEAKEVGGVAVSQADGTPWAYITQYQAKAACAALGAGTHLLTLAEALTISRSIEGIDENWTGFAVGIGALWRGFSSYMPNYYGDNGKPAEADTAGDPEDDPYAGIQAAPGGIEKRTLKLAGGEYIWDWAGNASEWLDFACTGGTGAGSWEATPYYQEWSAAGLQDYERLKAGPARNLTSAQNAGMYYGCAENGNVAMRGGSYVSGSYGGMYTFKAADPPTVSYSNVGFRCAR